MKRLVNSARYWWWRVQGTGGHLPNCRFSRIEMVGRAGGFARHWDCADGCPLRVREALAGRRYLEKWSGHRGR